MDFIPRTFVYCFRDTGGLCRSDDTCYMAIVFPSDSCEGGGGADVKRSATNPTADERCSAADERSSAADGRSSAADERSSAADERCSAADKRSSAADGRSSAADERSSAADEWSSAADGRFSAAHEDCPRSADSDRRIVETSPPDSDGYPALEEGKFNCSVALCVDGYGSISIVRGDPKLLSFSVQKSVPDNVRPMRPRAVYICDGSQYEFEDIVEKLQQRGVLRPLKACKNNYLVRTDPRDTQRIESNTFAITSQMHPTASGWTADHAKSDFANWMPATQLKENLDARFPACARGRMMYVIPFSIGPIGGYNSKYAVQLTDSPYVVASMRIMTRVNPAVWDAIGSSEDYVRCVHSIGCPQPVTFRLNQNWACNCGDLPPQRRSLAGLLGVRLLGPSQAS